MSNNPLFTQPKTDNSDHQVIMDLLWPHPLAHSINGTTPNMFLGRPTKMCLPAAQDLADLIKRVGRGAFLYSTDIARDYRQLLLDTVG